MSKVEQKAKMLRFRVEPSDQLGASGETQLNNLWLQLQHSATAQHLPNRHKVQDSVSEPQNNKDTKLPTRQSRSRPILALRADPSLWIQAGRKYQWQVKGSYFFAWLSPGNGQSPWSSGSNGQSFPHCSCTGWGPRFPSLKASFLHFCPPHFCKQSLN